MCACLNFVKIPNALSVFVVFLSVPVKPSAYVCAWDLRKLDFYACFSVYM